MRWAIIFILGALLLPIAALLWMIVIRVAVLMAA